MRGVGGRSSRVPCLHVHFQGCRRSGVLGSVMDIIGFTVFCAGTCLDSPPNFCSVGSTISPNALLGQKGEVTYC